MVIIRWLLLVLGGLALSAGLALSVLWWKAPAAPAAAQAKLRYEVVLVAARAIGPGTLLAPQDVRWEKMPASRVPAESLLRGRVAEKALLGAALRRRFRAGEPLSSGALVEPGAPGFLPAALAPGMRAVSLALDGAEGDSGLLDPGDRVDVVLTQDFAGPRVRPTRRSVGEIVLRNRRVVAVGRRIAPRRARERGPSGFARERRGGAPQTVTLEVTRRQAAELMVAGRLGRLQLALRGSGKGGTADLRRRRKDAVWAVDVSPALRALQESEARQAAFPEATPGRETPASGGAGMAVAVVRGTHFEWRCFDARERALASCSVIAPGPPPAAPAKPQPARVPTARTAGAPVPAS
jgi:pilus assembly protein CpaB